MPFKAGRLAELYLNGVDISGYFASADLALKLDTTDVTVFKAAWKSYLAGEAGGSLSASGYYDSGDADKVRDTLQSATLGQLTYMPAGGTTIGDQARLININSVDYKNGSKIGGAITMDWEAQATSTIGIGTVLAPLASYGVGAAVALTGDGLLTAAASTTGLVAHLHVTGYSAGTHTFKLQDATTQGGVYADIAGAAFTNVTATGSQRLVVTGTIRQYVRLVYTVATAACTFSVAAART